MNRACENACTAEARFFALTNTARATLRADAARESSTPGRITSAFVACANLRPNRRNLPKRVWPVELRITLGPDSELFGGLPDPCAEHPSASTVRDLGPCAAAAERDLAIPDRFVLAKPIDWLLRKEQ